MRDSLFLALGILSGRIVRLTDDEYRLLGFDPYKFSRFGSPSLNDVKAICEEIISELLMDLYERLYSDADSEYESIKR